MQEKPQPWRFCRITIRLKMPTRVAEKGMSDPDPCPYRLELREHEEEKPCLLLGFQCVAVGVEDVAGRTEGAEVVFVTRPNSISCPWAIQSADSSTLRTGQGGWRTSEFKQMAKTLVVGAVWCQPEIKTKQINKQQKPGLRKQQRTANSRA